MRQFPLRIGHWSPLLPFRTDRPVPVAGTMHNPDELRLPSFDEPGIRDGQFELR